MPCALWEAGGRLAAAGDDDKDNASAEGRRKSEGGSGLVLLRWRPGRGSAVCEDSVFRRVWSCGWGGSDGGGGGGGSGACGCGGGGSGSGSGSSDGCRARPARGPECAGIAAGNPGALARSGQG